MQRAGALISLSARDSEFGGGVEKSDFRNFASALCSRRFSIIFERKESNLPSSVNFRIFRPPLEIRPVVLDLICCQPGNFQAGRVA